MPDGSKFHTAGAATLKPQEAKVVQTRGTENISEWTGMTINDAAKVAKDRA